MRIALVWLAVWFVVVSSARAESIPAYSLLRENEDWSFLRDPRLRRDIWDPLKYIRLGSNDWYLTIGGEVREVFEQVGNDNWGKQPHTNTFFLERYMLHSECPAKLRRPQGHEHNRLVEYRRVRRSTRLGQTRLLQ